MRPRPLAARARRPLERLRYYLGLHICIFTYRPLAMPGAPAGRAIGRPGASRLAVGRARPPRFCIIAVMRSALLLCRCSSASLRPPPAGGRRPSASRWPPPASGRRPSASLWPPPASGRRPSASLWPPPASGRRPSAPGQGRPRGRPGAGHAQKTAENLGFRPAGADRPRPGAGGRAGAARHNRDQGL